MNEIQEKKNITFIFDLPKYPISEQVVICGTIEKQKTLKKGIKGVWLKDITGKLLCIIDTKKDPIAPKLNLKDLWFGTRIKITGQLAENSREELILKNINDIQVLFSPRTTKLSELAPEIREQASKVLISRVCRIVSELMLANHFIEFSSRVISKYWDDEGLEPMQVLYPGFGSPAFLIPSPSAQIVEILITALISRAFTISTSFTQTYRFPNSPSEMCVIVAKATDLDIDNQIKLFQNLSKRILKEFKKNMETFPVIEGVWPNTIEGKNIDNIQLSEELNLVKYSANIPVIGINWDSHISLILHLLDKDGNILAEGARESLPSNVEISTITIYPSQFLGLIEKAQPRQLQNLMRLYDGRR